MTTLVILSVPFTAALCVFIYYLISEAKEKKAKSS
jgi:hypothetical protein